MKYGFIGCGNMGSAVIRAVCGASGAEHVLIANRTPEKAQILAQELGCAVGSNQDAATCEYVFLGVKPQMIRDVLSGIRETVATHRPILVTMAAGITTTTIQSILGADYPVIRIMPNTPVAVGAGMVLYCTNNVPAEREQEFLTAMAKAGRLDRLDEKLIDAGTSVSGCGPAWACMFLQALADGGVACGLPREKATLYAAQMLLGTASLVLETGKHPEKLKDEVCSPAGSTIQGVLALENNGFRGAVTDAVNASYQRNIELGKK